MAAQTFISGLFHGKYDKTAHVLISLIVTFVALFFLHVGWALLAVFLLGFMKEIFDVTILKRRFETPDLVANAVGIISGFIIWRLLFIFVS